MGPSESAPGLKGDLFYYCSFWWTLAFFQEETSRDDDNTGFFKQDPVSGLTSVWGLLVKASQALPR